MKIFFINIFCCYLLSVSFGISAIILSQDKKLSKIINFNVDFSRDLLIKVEGRIALRTMDDKVLNLAKVIPSFLDQSFFDKVVRSMEKDPNAKVTQFDIKAGSKPGENFASAIFRCSMTFKSKFTKVDKTISVIIKTKPILEPEMADYAAILDNSPFFRNEMALYGNILPDIQTLMISAGDTEVFSPK